LLLADEINRSSPKVQSALLEAMAENQVTIGEQSFKLKEPFMVLATANPIDQEGTQILDFTSFLELKNQIASVHIDGAVKEYMLKIIFATREPKSYNLENIAKYIEFGVSPRGSIALYKTSRAIAFIEGRDFVTPADVARASYLAIGHRIKLSYEAIVDGINSKQIIRRILETIPAP